MLAKPAQCSSCRYSLVSQGYVTDHGDPETAKIALMLTIPSDKDLVSGQLWAGRSAEYWLEYLLKPADIEISDLYVTSAVRCRGPKIPTGVILENAIRCCRQYDSGLQTFAPTLAIATYSLADCAKTPALSRLVIADLRKAVRMHARGFKPLVLLGDAPTKLVFPYITGLRHWRGHYQELEGWTY